MTIDYGHTSFEVAFERGDVYGVKDHVARSAKRPLRIGVVGCGGVAQAKWLPAIRRLQTIGEPLALAGLVDSDEEVRRKVGPLWCAPAFDSLAALLASGKPDIILVTTADEAHVPVASDAVRAGIPCLVEKPLARALADACGLCELAEKSGVLLAGVANKRFSPPYAQAKAIIEDGGLKSPPRLFQGKFTFGYRDVDLLESGTVHMFDLALWFMGPAARVHAIGTFAGAAPSGKLESAVISLAFASGAIGSVTTSATALSFKPWERVEIFGRNAMLHVEDQFDLTLYDEETGPAKTWRPAIPNTLMFDESFGGYVGLLENVLDAIRGVDALRSTGRDAAAAVELIEAAKLSLASGGPIDLPLASAETLTPRETDR
jgi:predicted dehydrogenase